MLPSPPENTPPLFPEVSTRGPLLFHVITKGKGASPKIASASRVGGWEEPEPGSEPISQWITYFSASVFRKESFPRTPPEVKAVGGLREAHSQPVGEAGAEPDRPSPPPSGQY